MTRPLPLILFGILLLTACTAGVSAEDTLGEKLIQAPTETYDQIVQSYLLENPAPKPGIYTYGETLKVTSFADGTLSVVSVSIQENTETHQMDLLSQLLYTLGLHKITDIYTVTRTDYSPQGDVEIKLALSGWFETGPLLPLKSYITNFKNEQMAETYSLVSMNAGASPVGKISGSLLVEKDGVISSYDLTGFWDREFHYCESVTYPQVFPTEGETELCRIACEDKEITAEMSVWFSFDGKTAPKAHVTDIRGISHQGNYLCTAEYTIEEDTGNGQTQVMGFVTAHNVHNSEDAVEYILKAYCTKYGDWDSSTEKRTL
ncbi:MAG: hypothetical protein IJA20_05835 [Methanocorpusculum sp.]|nr:hypothetical protein [Methanocorpusculum sp.]